MLSRLVLVLCFFSSLSFGQVVKAYNSREVLLDSDSFSPFPFDATEYDYSDQSNRVTDTQFQANKTGVFFLSAGLRFDGDLSKAHANACFVLNDDMENGVLQCGHLTPGNIVAVSVWKKLFAKQYISLYVFQNTGKPTVISSNSWLNMIQITRDAEDK